MITSVVTRIGRFLVDWGGGGEVMYLQDGLGYPDVRHRGWGELENPICLKGGFGVF